MWWFATRHVTHVTFTRRRSTPRRASEDTIASSHNHAITTRGGDGTTKTDVDEMVGARRGVRVLRGSVDDDGSDGTDGCGASG